MENHVNFEESLFTINSNNLLANIDDEKSSLGDIRKELEFYAEVFEFLNNHEASIECYVALSSHTNQFEEDLLQDADFAYRIGVQQAILKMIR